MFPSIPSHPSFDDQRLAVTAMVLVASSIGRVVVYGARALNLYVPSADEVLTRDVDFLMVAGSAAAFDGAVHEFIHQADMVLKSFGARASLSVSAKPSSGTRGLADGGGAGSGGRHPGCAVYLSTYHVGDVTCLSPEDAATIWGLFPPTQATVTSKLFPRDTTIKVLVSSLPELGHRIMSTMLGTPTADGITPPPGNEWRVWKDLRRLLLLKHLDASCRLLATPKCWNLDGGHAPTDDPVSDAETAEAYRSFIATVPLPDGTTARGAVPLFLAPYCSPHSLPPTASSHHRLQRPQLRGGGLVAPTMRTDGMGPDAGGAVQGPSTLSAPTTPAREPLQKKPLRPVGSGEQHTVLNLGSLSVSPSAKEGGKLDACAPPFDPAARPVVGAVAAVSKAVSKAPLSKQPPAGPIALLLPATKTTASAISSAVVSASSRVDETISSVHGIMPAEGPARIDDSATVTVGTTFVAGAHGLKEFMARTATEIDVWCSRTETVFQSSLGRVSASLQVAEGRVRLVGAWANKREGEPAPSSCWPKRSVGGTSAAAGEKRKQAAAATPPSSGTPPASHATTKTGGLACCSPSRRFGKVTQVPIFPAGFPQLVAATTNGHSKPAPTATGRSGGATPVQEPLAAIGTVAVTVPHTSSRQFLQNLLKAASAAGVFTPAQVDIIHDFLRRVRASTRTRTAIAFRGVGVRRLINLMKHRRMRKEWHLSCTGRLLACEAWYEKANADALKDREVCLCSAAFALSRPFWQSPSLACVPCVNAGPLEGRPGVG